MQSRSPRLPLGGGDRRHVQETFSWLTAHGRAADSARLSQICDDRCSTGRRHSAPYAHADERGLSQGRSTRAGGPRLYCASQAVVAVRVARIGSTLVIGMLLQACGSLPRLDAVPPALTEGAAISGGPNSRYWLDNRDLGFEDRPNDLAVLKSECRPPWISYGR